MARFALSIADDVAAQLDAYAAAENLFRNAFKALGDQAATTTDPGESEDEPVAFAPQLVYVGASGELAEQFREMRDYLTILYSRPESLRNYVLATVDHTEAPPGMNYPRTLPEPSWVGGVKSHG